MVDQVAAGSAPGRAGLASAVACRCFTPAG